MFVVDDSTAEAIRRTYEEAGEFAAAVELRRHFPGLMDNENTRLFARTIAGWRPVAIPKRTRIKRLKSTRKP